jgi:ribosomal protein S18 acetylase RimI-like enzyme
MDANVRSLTDPGSVRRLETEAEVAICFPLMQQLRPQLATTHEFVVRWKRQAEAGYRLAALWHGKTAVALAGYRITENLVHGHHLYVDDLVTNAEARGNGYGAELLNHLKHEAREAGCSRLVLDSGLSNALAHRFYYRQGLLAVALRFTTQIEA